MWASPLVSGAHTAVRTDAGRLRTCPQAGLATPTTVSASRPSRRLVVSVTPGRRSRRRPSLGYLPEGSSKRRVGTPPATWLLNKTGCETENRRVRRGYAWVAPATVGVALGPHALHLEPENQGGCTRGRNSA